MVESALSQVKGCERFGVSKRRLVIRLLTIFRILASTSLSPLPFIDIDIKSTFYKNISSDTDITDNSDRADMLLYFVRHGQTALYVLTLSSSSSIMMEIDVRNCQGIIQGHLDPPLSPLGAEQAAKLGVYLAQEGFSEVWTSDLQRAEQVFVLVLP